MVSKVGEMKRSVLLLLRSSSLSTTHIATDVHARRVVFGFVFFFAEETTGEDSGDSACSSSRSVIAAPSGAVAIASTGKHVVLVTSSPAKPTTSMVATMSGGSRGSATGATASKVDTSQGTKIDMLDSASTCSTVSRDELGGEDARGAIHLTLSYDPAAGILNVKLVEVMASELS